MKAKSIKGKSPEEIESALKQSMSDGFKPTLAIAFISINQDRKAICQILHNQGVEILGATSSGEFINGYEGQGSAVILLMNLRPESHAILFEDAREGSLSDAATRLAHAALKKFKKPAFILCSTGISAKGEYLDGEVIVRTLEKEIGPQVNIYGGMAGDDYTITGTYVFSHEKETDVGLAALVLDEEKITVQGMAISGWKPLGILRTITKSEGALVFTIDDEPALDLYLRYLGKKATTTEDKYKAFQEVGVHYPFQVEREAGEPVMRTPMMFSRDKNALMFDFDVPQGSKVRFSMPPDLDIVEQVIDKANEVKDSSQADAEALLIFSCAGRLSAMGPLANLENEGLTDVWKAPMAGFYTYGEYGRAINGRQEFHSTTCCWVTLKEK
jgi:hypothetical protein